MKFNVEIDTDVLQAVIELLKTPLVTLTILVLGMGLLFVVLKIVESRHAH